jgi:exodeoxyribonuclease VII large subunit
MGRQLVRLTKFRIVDARSRVQEHALSQVFDEVKTKLRNARVDANSATHQLQVAMTRLVKQATFRTNTLVQQISPAQLQTRVAMARARYDAAAASCSGAMNEKLQSGKERLGLAAASLDALSPLAVLHRGYAIAQSADGRLLRDAASVKIGDQIDVRLAQGKLRSKVEQVED